LIPDTQVSIPGRDCADLGRLGTEPNDKMVLTVGSTHSIVPE
jgi:hypothetical protein